MIIINGRFFSRRATGVDRFAYEIISSIDELIQANDPSVAGLNFKILLPPGIKPERNFLHIPMATVGKHTGQIWEQWDLSRSLTPGSLLLNLCNTGPVLTRNQIIVIHDAAIAKIPAAFSLQFRLWYRILLPLLGKVARKVITVSEFSKSEIIPEFKIPSNKVSVVIESGEHILKAPSDKNAIRNFGLSKRPYILAVSSMAAHKNFRLVLEAMSQIENPPFDIAIAGGANSRVFGNSGIVTSDNLKWLGYVSDSELRALYESALCFVFPSLYEGFGIPPLEAMQCGCPVLASRSASIPEVCGDAAMYFDADKPDQLADLLIRAYNEAGLLSQLKQKGYDRSAMYSWRKAALQVIDCLREG